jgi:ABC-type polysaccharide/polyol phosphate transport system ATPase subunit
LKKPFARSLEFVKRSQILMVASHQDDTLRRLCNKGA